MKIAKATLDKMFARKDCSGVDPMLKDGARITRKLGRMAARTNDCRVSRKTLDRMFGKGDGGPGSGPKAGSKTEHAIRKERNNPSIQTLSEEEIRHVLTEKALAKYLGKKSKDAGTSEGAKKAAETRKRGGWGANGPQPHKGTARAPGAREPLVKNAASMSPPKSTPEVRTSVRPAETAAATERRYAKARPQLTRFLSGLGL